MLRLFKNFSTVLKPSSSSKVLRNHEFYSALLQKNAKSYKEMYTTSSDLLAYIRTNTLGTSAKTQVLQAFLTLQFAHDPELTKEMVLIAESLKDDQYSLSPTSYTELFNWALNAGEDFSDVKSHILNNLWDRTIKLGSHDKLQSSHLIDLSYQFAKLGMTSSLLCEKISVTDSNSFSLADLNKIIYCCNKTLGKSADKLYSIASRVLNNTPIENYEYSQISELLESLSYKDRSYSDPFITTILYKLSGYLKDNLDLMRSDDMIHILEFYSNLPKFSNSLLLQMLDKIITDTMTASTMSSVIQYLGRHEFKNLRVNNQVAGKLRDKFKDMIQNREMSTSEYVECINNSFIHFNSKDLKTHLELQFKKLEKGSWVLLILKSMEKLNMNDFHEVLSEDLSNLTQGISQLTPREKLLALNNVSMLFSYPQQKETIKSALNDSILQDVKSPNKLTQYINSLISLETSRRIDPVILPIRTIKSHFLNLLLAYPSSKLVSQQALYLQRIDPNLCTKIIQPYISTLNSHQLLDFLNTLPNGDITHVMTVLRCLPKVEDLVILECLKYLTPDSNRQNSTELLDRANQLPGSVITHPSFKYNYSYMFEHCYKIGGVTNIVEFLKKIDEYLYKNVEICYDPYYLRVASEVSHLSKLKPETAREIVKIIMTKDKIEPQYLHIKLAEHSDPESIEEFRNKFISQIFDLGQKLTFKKIESILDAVRSWPFKEVYEDELEQKIVHKIANCSIYDMDNLLKFMLNFKAPVYDIHNKILRSVLKAITDSLTKYLFIFETEEKLQIFNSLTRHNSIKLIDVYVKLLSDFEVNLHKYNPSQINKIIEYMGKRGLRQDEFIMKMSEYIRKSPNFYHFNAPFILNTFAELNLENQGWACDTVSILVDSVNKSKYKYPTDYIYSIYIWALVRFQFPLDELERLVKESNRAKVTSGFNFKKYLLHNHFILNPIDTPYGDTEQIKRIPKSISMKSKFNYHSSIYHSLKNRLESLGIESIKGYCMNDIYIPIHLPKQNKSIWVIDPSQNIYTNSQFLRGEFQTYREQLEDFKLDMIMEHSNNMHSISQEGELDKWLKEKQILV